MPVTYLYVETDSAYNFRIEKEENDTRPNDAFLMDWVRAAEEQGGYYHKEDKAFFPWHSILGVFIKER